MPALGGASGSGVGLGWSLAAAAEVAGVSERTAWKWVRRFRPGGRCGLGDRSSAPKRCRVADAGRAGRVILLLRGVRFTAGEIAETLGMAALDGRRRARPARARQAAAPGPKEPEPTATSGGAGRARAHRRQEARPARPARVMRQRRPPPTQAIFARVSIRLGVRVRPRSTTRPGSPTSRCSPAEMPRPAAGFLRRAVAFFARYGIWVEGVLTDNGVLLPGGRCTRSPARALASQTPAHSGRTRPRTNGKSTLHSAPSSMAGRSAPSTARAPNAPPHYRRWLHTYNHHRPHRSLGRKPPATRLAELHNEARTHS